MIMLIDFHNTLFCQYIIPSYTRTMYTTTADCINVPIAHAYDTYEFETRRADGKDLLGILFVSAEHSACYKRISRINRATRVHWRMLYGSAADASDVVENSYPDALMNSTPLRRDVHVWCTRAGGDNLPSTFHRDYVSRTKKHPVHAVILTADSVRWKTSNYACACAPKMHRTSSKNTLERLKCILWRFLFYNENRTFIFYVCSRKKKKWR